jgi:predicted aldo/keto reductase-like oxidoreductase
MSLSRRQFLESTALTGLAAGAIHADTKMPTRVLGKTGVRISIIGLGTGSRFLLMNDEEKAIESLQKGLDLGINFIDTADSYGRNHISEERVGKAIKGRRQGIFLVTKLSERDGDKAQRVIEASLKALQVDSVDLIHVHELRDAEDLKSIEAKGGALDQVRKMRDQKLTKYIGITSHGDPEIFTTAIERHDFDCAQMTINAAMMGMVNGGKGRGLVLDGATKSFEQLALPVALRKKMGILAIKVYGQDHLIGQAPPEKLLYYALSLPIDSAVIGMQKLEQVEDNVRMAKAFRPLPKAEMKTMARELSAKNKAKLELFFRDHVDA